MNASPQEIEQIVQTSIKKTGRNIGCVGFFAIALGGFMIALHAFKLDPSARNMSTFGQIALYFFAILFILAGVAMFYVSMFKNGESGKKLLTRLQHQPETIREVYVNHLFSTNAPTRIDVEAGLPAMGVFYLVIDYKDDSTYQIKVTKQDIPKLWGYLQQQVPHATQMQAPEA